MALSVPALLTRIVILSAILGLALVAAPASPVTGTADASTAFCTWNGEPADLVDGAQCTVDYTLQCVEGMVEEGACQL